MSRHKVRLAALKLVLCTLGSVGFGFAYFGHQIFNHELTYFQFVYFGVVAGVFVAVLPTAKSRWLVLMGAFAMLGLALNANSNTPMRLIRDVVGVLSVFVAVRLGLGAGRMFPALYVGKFVVWGAIFAVTHVCAFLFLVLIKTQSIEANPEFVIMVARIGALLGAGVGLGYELAIIVANRVLYRRDEAGAARSPTA